jgi:hypothetical protein
VTAREEIRLKAKPVVYTGIIGTKTKRGGTGAGTPASVRHGRRTGSSRVEHESNDTGFESDSYLQHSRGWRKAAWGKSVLMVNADNGKFHMATATIENTGSFDNQQNDRTGVGSSYFSVDNSGVSVTTGSIRDSLSISLKHIAWTVLGIRVFLCIITS